MCLVTCGLWGCAAGARAPVVSKPFDPGHPVDVEELIAEYPLLKGRAVTAPEYLEEVLDRGCYLKDLPVFEYRINPYTNSWPTPTYDKIFRFGPAM